MSSSMLSATFSSSLSHIPAPPPSHDVSMEEVIMPNVVVVPPEEEQHENPPWLYFDASDAAQAAHSVEPDMDALEMALSYQQQVDNRAPIFHRSLQDDSQETVVLPRKGSLADLKESLPQPVEATRNIRPVVLDEEIVEVFKVRRHKGEENAEEQERGQMKRSKTFRARASEAFRSIKNVGKGSRRPLASASGPSESEHNVRSAENQHRSETIPRPGTPTLSRRKSLVLSQLFTFSQNSRHAAPEIDDAALPSSPTSLMSPVSLTSPTDSVSSLPQRHSFQTLPSAFTSPKSHAQRLQPSPSLEDCIDPRLETAGRTASSHPTLSRRKSFRQRISVLELQKLFTLSSSPSMPSSDSPQTPVTPVDDFAVADSDPYSVHSPDSEMVSPSTTSSFSLISEGSYSSSSDVQISDHDSMELRLDSLQFDSLHFDPDEF